MNVIHKILILLFGVAICVQAVPPVLNYAGQVAVNGEAFDGNGLFKFALVNADGTTTYWSNDGTSVDGSEPQASVAVPVNGGLYSILLGNTAQQGMGAIDPAVFAQHTDAKLRVWFSDGVNGFQQLSPDRPFASVPYAFNSKSSDTANTAMAVQAGAITKQMLGSDLLTDINATIGMNRLSTEVTEKLNQEKTTTNYNAPSVGSLLAVPYGSDAPAGYSLYQRGEPKALVWEEKAPVSVARLGGDGVEAINGRLYFAGGKNSSAQSRTFEYYQELTNEWVTLSELSENRDGVSTVILNNELYLIGGRYVSSVKKYNLLTNSWSSVASLPLNIRHADAIVFNNKIYLIGGINDSDQRLNNVFEFSPISNEWLAKANMPTARLGARLALLDSKIWAIGGSGNSHTRKVEIYDPIQNSWTAGPSLTFQRHAPVIWVLNGKIYVGGGLSSNFGYQDSIEVYDPALRKWIHFGNFPEPKYYADSVILNDTVYVVAGFTGNNIFSNKVFAADLNASMEGIYDLYRKDGDAPVGTPVVQSEYADGSVTTSKLDATILKYLKPEITAQPQAQTVYAYSNFSYSVTAEGKYLSYQWKKDGVDLTSETNATLNITDANATLHDGNYSVVVSNDFGSVESDLTEVLVKDGILNGLVGWWKFDEGSGTVAYDSSGNGNDGNLMNGPTWTDGKVGGALSFDGANSEVNCGNDSSLELSGEITLASWINPNSGADNSKIFGKTDNGPDNGYAVNWDKNYEGNFPGGGIQHMNAGNEWREWGNGSEEFTANTWYHIVYTKKNSIEYAYVNTVLVNQWLVKRNIPTNNADFKIGYSEDAVSGFNGLIDDVRIYDRALSAEEVQALYNLGQ